MKAERQQERDGQHVHHFPELERELQKTKRADQKDKQANKTTDQNKYHMEGEKAHVSECWIYIDPRCESRGGNGLHVYRFPELDRLKKNREGGEVHETKDEQNTKIGK